MKINQVNPVGDPGPKLVELLGCNKTYPAQWKKDTIDIAELARKRFIDKWPRKRLMKHFGRSRTTITDWTGRLQKMKFRFKEISPDLQKKLRIAIEKQRRGKPCKA